MEGFGKMDTKAQEIRTTLHRGELEALIYLAGMSWPADAGSSWWLRYHEQSYSLIKHGLIIRDDKSYTYTLTPLGIAVLEGSALP